MPEGRVLIVDDPAVIPPVRQRSCLDQSDIEMVAIADNVEGVPAAIGDYRPDVLILDTAPIRLVERAGSGSVAVS